MSNRSSTEIEESMSQLLTPTYIEKKASSNGALEAMQNLVKAAEIFENLDMVAVAKVVTGILEKVGGRYPEAVTKDRIGNLKRKPDEIINLDSLNAFMEEKHLTRMRIGQVIFYYDLETDELSVAPDEFGIDLPDMAEEFVKWREAQLRS